MGSLSDACTNTIITYFPEIYNHLERYLIPDEVCNMVGACHLQYHKHDDVIVEITPLSQLGVVDVK